MSAAAARTLFSLRSVARDPTARRVVITLLALVVILAVGLLTASLVPTSLVAGRLLAVSGEARGGGTYTQDLVAHFGERLRLAAGLLLALAAALVLVRVPLEELIGAALQARPGSLPRPARVTWLGVGGLSILALGVRLAFVNQPMRYDEALTFNEFASRPLYYGLSFYPDPNNHLLNTLLVHLTFSVLGNQPWVLRLPALLGGVLLVPATYALARLLYGARAAVFSAALIAVSSYVVEYSTNSRGYTLQALCFVVMLGLVIRVVRRDSPVALLLAVLVAAVGAYALPTMAYGVAVAAVWFVLEARRGPGLGRIQLGQLVAGGVLLGLLVVLLYLPVLLVSGANNLAANRFVTSLDLADLWAQLPVSLARTWSFWTRDVPWPLAALLVIGFGIASIAELRARRVPLGILAAGVCLVCVLLQRVAPFERVWLFLLPLYFVIAAGGLARYVDGRLLAVGFGAIVGFFTLTSGSILASPETGAFPDAESVAHSLSGRLVTGDAVLSTLPASLPELQYYFPRSGLSIETLVASPDAAPHVYVVTAPDTSPQVPGWTSPVPIAGYPQSVLVELSRASS